MGNSSGYGQQENEHSYDRRYEEALPARFLGEQ
jgi:hypothetical protein